MKKLTTIICCICFAIFGIGLAKYGVGPPSHTLSANAAQPIQWAITPKVGFGPTVSPIALVSAAEEQESLENTEPLVPVDSTSAVIDSLKKKIEALEKASVKTRTSKASVPKSAKKNVGKKKSKKVFEPDKLPGTAKQMGVKQSTGCIAVYELRQVDEICQKDSLSTKRVNEHDSGVYE